MEVKDEEVKAPEKAALKANSVKVRLLGSHTHEGVSYDAGDIIDVDESSAKYIIEIGKSGVKV